MEFALPVAGCSNDFGQLFACSNTKIANHSLSQKPIVKSESLPVCFCCLASEAPLVNAERCNHTEFVKIYFQNEYSSKLWICCLCHYMLIKIEAFRLQIYKSFVHRNSKQEHPNQWKLINNLSFKTKVSIISLGNDEKPLDLGYEDPLFTAEVIDKVKDQECKTEIDDLFESDENTVKTYNVSFEPKVDLDSDTLNASTCSYLNASSTKHTDKRTKKHSEDIKPVQIIIKKETKSGEIKQDGQEIISTVFKENNKNKTKMFVRKITETPKEKLESNTERLPQQIEIHNDEETTNIIYINPNLYKGKIKTIELTREELERERQNERENESWIKQKFRCESCLKGFEYSHVLEIHNERHHKILDSTKSMMTCDICNCILSNSSLYKAHYKTHFTRYVCMICESRSDDLPKTAFHYNTEHNDLDSKQIEYKCGHCNFTTNKRKIYSYHNRRLHDPKLCTICNKAFTGRISYDFHMKTHQSKGTPKKGSTKSAKRYKCEHCDRAYFLPSVLRDHIKICHSDDTNTYYCKQCDKQFKTEKNYRIHLTRSSAHTSIDEIFKYMCDYCGKKTNYKDIMESHIEREHLKTNRHKCQTCNKIFDSDKFVKRHMQSVHNKHELPKNKICQYCGKAFATVVILRMHIRKHTGERPLKCDICDMTFAYNASLFNHRRLKHKIPRKRELQNRS